MRQRANALYERTKRFFKENSGVAAVEMAMLSPLLMFGMVAMMDVGVAVSEDGFNFKRLSDVPLVPNGSPGSWNSSESGHPYLFQDTDDQDYLFYQGNNTNGKTWYLSVLPIVWDEGRPKLAPERLAN